MVLLQMVFFIPVAWVQLILQLIVEGGVGPQTRQTLINLKAILDEVGADFSQVVKTTAHLQNCVADFAEYDKVYREFLTAPFPVRTTVGSDLINILVEIDFVVAL
jgi:2-iminobutanoate/2-iminopropanoate deaminase